jgi:hypothetical protein
MGSTRTLRQVSPAAWGARIDYDRRPHVQDRDGVTLHNTGTKDTQAKILAAGTDEQIREAERARLRAIEKDHIESNGWKNGIGYSDTVGPSGTLYRCRGAGTGAHNPGDSDGDGISDNEDSSGLLLLVGIGEHPTAAMWRTVCAYLDDRGGTIKGHRESRSTECPGDVVMTMLDGYRDGTRPAPAPASKPEPTPKPDTTTSNTWTEAMMRNLPTLRERTNLNRATQDDRRLQGLLAAAGTLSIERNIVDGQFDGKFGASTAAAVRTFQKGRGLKVDGVCGQNTWKGLLDA